MAANLIQPSFAGGELSPSLYSRVDIARYGTSLRKNKNFIVRPYGGVDNRPGLQFISEVKASATTTRLIPFEYSSTIAYVIELGDEYARFIFQGAQVESGGSPVEIATPWSAAEIWDVKFTQSADVMYLVHPAHPPQELRRLTAVSFELREFEASYGPFRSINADEAIKVASSAALGETTLTSNDEIFSSDLVGSLVYIEQKDLTGTRPWEPGERGVIVGAQRRSDGKTYRASSVPVLGGATWLQTGANKPVHDSGKAWDGPGDSRTSGTDSYIVGVEWEYLHSGFGIVLITSYVSPTEVDGIVVKRVPDSCVGGVSVGTTWNLVGDGVTKTFAIAGAASPSEADYTVTIGGVPTQSNPYYQAPDSCVATDSLLPDGRTAGEVKVGDRMLLADPLALGGELYGIVSRSEPAVRPCYRILTALGVSLVCSDTAPIPVRRGGYRTPGQLMGHSVPIKLGDVVTWSVVADLQFVGLREVQHITVENACFWAGEREGSFILHHNAKPTE